MHRFIVLLIMLPIAIGFMPSSAAATTLARPGLLTCTSPSAIDRTVAYIRTQQRSDGAFPSVGQGSTADAVYSLIASGVNPSEVKANGKSAIDWIYSQTSSLQSTGIAAKFLLALALAHRSTVAPNGFNFAARVEHSYDPSTGLYDSDPTGNAYALIALRAVNHPIPPRAIQAWAALQQPDGGWSAYLPPRETDTNTTAVGLVALIVNGHQESTRRALGYLRTQQNPDGGFAFSTIFGAISDANSTSLVTLALLMANQDLANWEIGGNDPVARLLQLQNPSGAFRFNDELDGDNAFATFQAGQATGVTRCH